MRIIGHKKQMGMLLTAIRNNRLHSSYMFVGQAGIGKRQSALYLAQMLNCLKNKGLDYPCGECSSCRKIETGIHPDVMTISVMEEKSWISIEQIREMISGLQYRALSGGYNVRIIDDAHLIKEDAANSLLKILEEPPADTVIILITPVPRSLPGTILSRCILMQFGIFTDEEIKKEIEKYSLNNEETDFVVSLAMGSLGKAIKIAGDRELISKYSNILDDFLEYKLPDKKIDRKESLDFLNLLASWLRQNDISKLDAVLRTQNFIRRNVNVDLAMEVLRMDLKIL